MTKKQQQTFWRENRTAIINGTLVTVIASLILNLSGLFGAFFAKVYATLGVYDYYASLDIATGLLVIFGGIAVWRIVKLRRGKHAKNGSHALFQSKKSFLMLLATIVMVMSGGVLLNVYQRLHDTRQFVIVVAQFAGSNPDQHMIPQTLEKFFRDQQHDDIVVKLIPQTIASDNEAERIGRQNRAAAVVYGFYRSDTPQEIVAYARLTRDVTVSRTVSLSRTDEKVAAGTIDSSITTQKDTLPFGMAVDQMSSGIVQLGLFLRGIDQLNGKQYTAAAVSFDKALNQSESHQELSADTLRYYRALANLAQDKFDAAKDDLETVLASSTNPSQQVRANANHALGDIAYIHKQYTDADARYSDAIGLNGKDLDAYTNRGFARNNLRRYHDALTDFDAAIKLSKDYTKRYAYPYNGRGVAFWRQNQPNQALQEFDKALRIDKKYADPLINKAQVLADKKDFKGAMLAFDQALKVKPKNAVAYYDRAVVQDAWHNRDAAIADYTQAVTYDPDYANAYNNRGALQLEKKDYDKAIADFDMAIRLQPDNGSFYHNRAGALYDKGTQLYSQAATSKQGADLIVKAGDDADKAIGLRPDIAAAYVIRGQIYMLGGEQYYDNALTEFTNALARDDKNAKVYKSRGTIYEVKQQYDLAAADFARGRSLNPQDPDYCYAEGRAQTRSGNYDKAVAAYDKAVSLAPGTPEPYLQRALFYAGRQDLAKAHADAQKVIELDKTGKQSAAADAILKL